MQGADGLAIQIRDDMSGDLAAVGYEKYSVAVMTPNFKHSERIIYRILHIYEGLPGKSF